jgi:hypothetical protein
MNVWHGKDFADALEASSWLFQAACLAELALRLDDAAVAAPLYDFLAPHRDKNVVVGQGIAYNGPVARILGMLAFVLRRDEAAAADFEHALARARAFDAQPWLARTQIGYARLLARRGSARDAQRAREALAEARDIAQATEGNGLLAEIALTEALVG